jgi:multiple antibiotic resistance protein
MQSLPVSDLLEQFLFGFSTLFAIINPYGLAFIFLDRTMAISDAERRILAKRIALTAFCVLVVSLFAGAAILRFFGISVPALRIGGGLVVAVSGWKMLHEPEHEPAREDRQPRSTQTLESLRRMTFFPLTVPLTTGPGSIATAIALAASRPAELRGAVRASIISVVVALAVCLVILHAYSRAGTMARLFGREGTSAITRLSAFLLLCVGVQIVLTGTLDGIRPMLVAPQ